MANWRYCVISLLMLRDRYWLKMGRDVVAGYRNAGH